MCVRACVRACVREWCVRAVRAADCRRLGGQAERVWARLESGNRFTDVLLSIATGELTPEDEEHVGLVRTHAYAVLDVRMPPRARGLSWGGGEHLHIDGARR